MIPRIENVVTLLSQASATLTCLGPNQNCGTWIRYANFDIPFESKSLEVSVPTSQPRRVGDAFRDRRFCAMR